MTTPLVSNIKGGKSIHICLNISKSQLTFNDIISKVLSFNWSFNCNDSLILKSNKAQFTKVTYFYLRLVQLRRCLRYFTLLLTFFYRLKK